MRKIVFYLNTYRRGVPNRVIDVIRSMYKNTEIVVTTESGEVLNKVTNKEVRLCLLYTSRCV